MNKENFQKLETILKSRFFISQTAGIYGGVSGLYDMGPVLYQMKLNFMNEWRKHFVHYDNLYEIDTSILLPYSVLKASGHVDKFCDILICDEKNNIAYRADHYIIKKLENMKATEEVLNDLKKVDTMNCEEIDALIKKYNLKTPDNNNFKPAIKFNLMFETSLGYKEGQSVFLRPETAQGQFLNFKKLLEFNNRKMPFGSASIGKAFRNEISPRSGLLRTREFEQAEIEFFVLPDEKKFKKFSTVSDLKIKLCFDDREEVLVLKDAVDKGIIDNEVLGYFIGRAYLFLVNLGINPEFLRFRQHKKDEMAHYAKDCWDVELYCSYGWVEAVGIADRSAYDLTCHSKHSKTDLSYSIKLDNPIITHQWKAIINKKDWIKTLKNKFEMFKEQVESLTNEEIIEKKYSQDDKVFIKHNFEGIEYQVECQYIESKIYEKKVVPDVIEPSFGIGRILYILLEHSFYIRDCGRPVLRIKPKIAYTKCVISYVIYNDEYLSEIERIRQSLYEKNITCEFNERSCSIGKKYASCDELGVPFFITFDVESLADKHVTIRERDSMDQVRVPISKVTYYIDELVSGRYTWDQLTLELLKV